MFLDYNPQSPQQYFWQMLAEISQDIPEAHKDSVQKSWLKAREDIIECIGKKVKTGPTITPQTTALIKQSKINNVYNEEAAEFLKDIFVASANNPSFLCDALKTVTRLYPQAHQGSMPELTRRLTMAEQALITFNENKDTSLKDFALEDFYNCYDRSVTFLSPTKGRNYYLNNNR